VIGRACRIGDAHVPAVRQRQVGAEIVFGRVLPAPIYFGADYVTQKEWWRVGFFVSVLTLTIWGTIGMVWWKILGWW